MVEIPKGCRGHHPLPTKVSKVLKKDTLGLDLSGLASPSSRGKRGFGSAFLSSDAGRVHQEVVHGPVRFEAVLADEGGELGVVADRMHHGVHKDGLAFRFEPAYRDGGELELLRPVEVGVRHYAA